MFISWIFCCELSACPTSGLCLYSLASVDLVLTVNVVLFCPSENLGSTWIELPLIGSTPGDTPAFCNAAILFPAAATRDCVSFK